MDSRIVTEKCFPPSRLKQQEHIFPQLGSPSPLTSSGTQSGSLHPAMFPEPVSLPGGKWELRSLSSEPLAWWEQEGGGESWVLGLGRGPHVA